MEAGVIIGLIILNVGQLIYTIRLKKDDEDYIESIKESQQFIIALNDRANRTIWDMAEDLADKNTEIERLKEKLIRIELDKEAKCNCTKNKRSVKK